MIFQECRDQLFMHALDNIDVAITVDVEQERHLAIDFCDVTFKDSLREHGVAGLHFDIVHQLLIRYTHAELDDIKMTRSKLRSAIGGKIDVRIVG